jgi:predicted transcriptional regulator
MEDKAEIIEMTTDIVSAYVGNNTVTAADLPSLIQSVHQALTGVVTGVVEVEAQGACGPAQEVDHPGLSDLPGGRA